MKKAKKISLIVAISILVFIFLVFSITASVIYGITKNENFDRAKLINPDLMIEIYDKDNNLISEKNMFNN